MAKEAQLNLVTICLMQCGPIRFNVSGRKLNVESAIQYESVFVTKSTCDHIRKQGREFRFPQRAVHLLSGHMTVGSFSFATDQIFAVSMTPGAQAVAGKPQLLFSKSGISPTASRFLIPSMP